MMRFCSNSKILNAPLFRMHLLDAIIDPYQKLKAKRAAWHSTPHIQYSIFFIPSYTITIFIPLASVYIYVAPPQAVNHALAFCVPAHLQPSLRPCAEAFRWPDRTSDGVDGGTVQEVPQQTQLLGVAVETPVRGREDTPGRWVDPSIFGELLETLSGRSGAGKQIYIVWLQLIQTIQGFSHNDNNDNNQYFMHGF